MLELGATSYTLGDRKRAKELREAGIATSRELGYTLGLVDILSTMGYVLLFESEYERATALHEEAAALLRERGYKTGLENALDNLGWAALLQDDPDRARTSYVASLTLSKEHSDKLVAAASLEGLACVAGVQGQIERAATLFGAEEALREAGGVRHTAEVAALREPYLVASRARLDEASWRAAWARGRAMSMDRAVEYAISEDKPPNLPRPSARRHTSGPTSPAARGRWRPWWRKDSPTAGSPKSSLSPGAR